MITAKLRNMSIKQKLTVIIMLTSSVITLLAVTVFTVWAVFDFRRHLVSDIQTHAGIIANNCTASLAFSDKKDAKQVLSALRAEDSIAFACIYDKQGRVFVEYQRGDITEKIQPPKCQKDNFAFENGYLSLFKQIYLDGEIIGTVYLRDDMSALYDELVRDIAVAIGTLVFLLLIAYLLSSKLQKAVSGPILNLAEVAKEVSEKKDYSTRAIKQTNDEVGLLINAFNEMLEQIQQRDLELVDAKEQLEIRVQQRTSELQAAQKKLIKTARQVGMAETATDVLHNVGNVLNSVSVTTASIRKRVHDSKVSYLTEVVGLLEEHADDLSTFMTTEERGRKLPAFLANLSQELITEQERSLEALEMLTKHVEHMAEIIQLQQSYSKTTSMVESASVVELVEDAIRINTEALTRHGVEVKREFADMPPALLDHHKVLQILINLISNAKYALSDSGRDDRILTICVKEPQGGHFRIEVHDNGIGITEENFTRIFKHGFTTKKHGYGFGLHSAAIAAKEMNGSLTAHSDGSGKGTIFTLELPFQTQEAVK